MASRFRCNNGDGQITLSTGPLMEDGTRVTKLTLLGLSDNGGTAVRLDRDGLEWLKAEIDRRLELP